MSKMLDLTGQKFGQLKALKRVGSNGRWQSLWLCECSCGKQIVVRLGNLRSGNSTSCGHAQREILRASRKAAKRDLIGQRVGRLVVVAEAEKHVGGSVMWLCQCDCGKSCQVSTGNLGAGRTKSCGCLRREVAAAVAATTHRTHGLTGTPEYDRTRKNKRRERKQELDSNWTHEMERALTLLQPTCVVCGGNEKMSTDHVHPLSKGYGLKPGNAVRLCTHCNSVKRARDLDALPTDMRRKIVGAALAFQRHWAVPVGDFMPNVILCPRCNTPCKQSVPVNPDARLLRRTSGMNGLCPNCAVTEFLLSVEPIRLSIEENGAEKVLLNTAVREQFMTVMRAGRADMRPDEINWQSMISNWSLPFPSRRKRGAAY